MSTRVIVNPSAGAGRAMRRLAPVRALLAARGGEVEWTTSRSAGHLQELAAEAAQRGYERVVVAGGDGAVHFAAAALAGTATALGILPVGTGNDLAAALGLPADPVAACRALLHGTATAIDVGRIGARVFCIVAGVGMDTPALQRIGASRFRRGRLLYQWAALRTLLTYRSPMLHVHGADLDFAGPCAFAGISNTRTYAGGIPLQPAADIADGQLDLCVIPGMSRVGLLSTFARLRRARHLDVAGVRSGRVTEVSVDSEEPVPVTLDGELTEVRTPFTARVWPGALRVLGAAALATVPVEENHAALTC